MTGSPPSLETLYAGPDLHRAAGESALRITLHDRFAGLRNAFVIGADIAGGRLRGRPEAAALELVIARGSAPGSGDSIAAAYAGTGANRDWCLSTVFPSYDVIQRTELLTPDDVAPAFEEAAAQAGVIFAEDVPDMKLPPAAWGSPPWAGSWPGSEAFGAMPAWVKQRLRVSEDWSRQLAALRRDTRQEISRVLRKYQYRCELTRRPAHHAHFYDSLYRPYVTRRFGSAAHVVDRERFLTECGRGVLLRLLQGSSVVGAALLRPLGRTLAVVWSALDPERQPDQLRGATDTMDYFSLLYAHLLRCRWLDLGPSRPDLFDGALRYKAKWGCELHTGLVPQPEIRWTCDNRSAGATSFLQRHAFLVKAGRGLRGLFFLDGACDAEAFRSRLAGARTAGVQDYRLVAMTPPGKRLSEIVSKTGADVTLVNATEPGHANA